MAFESMEEWLRSSADKNISTAEAVIQEDMSDRGVSREETWTQMSRMWEAMRSSEQDYDRTLRSHSGLVGGAAGQMENYLNPLRVARNEMPLETTISTTELRTQIQNEYIREFVGEGQTFFYFKRNESANIPTGTSATGTQTMQPGNYVIPLPDSETEQRED